MKSQLRGAFKEALATVHDVGSNFRQKSPAARVE